MARWIPGESPSEDKDQADPKPTPLKEGRDTIRIDRGIVPIGPESGAIISDQRDLLTSYAASPAPPEMTGIEATVLGPKKPPRKKDPVERGARTGDAITFDTLAIPRSSSPDTPQLIAVSPGGNTNWEVDRAVLEDPTVDEEASLPLAQNTLKSPDEPLELAATSQTTMSIDMEQSEASEGNYNRRRVKWTITLGAVAVAAAATISAFKLNKPKNEDDTTLLAAKDDKEFLNKDKPKEGEKYEEAMRLIQELETDLKAVESALENLDSNPKYKFYEPKKRNQKHEHPLTAFFKGVNQKLEQLGISCPELNCSFDSEASHLEALKRNIELIKTALAQLQENQKIQTLDDLIPPGEERCEKMADNASSTDCPTPVRSWPKRELEDYRELAREVAETRSRLEAVVEAIDSLQEW